MNKLRCSNLLICSLQLIASTNDIGQSCIGLSNCLIGPNVTHDVKEQIQQNIFIGCGPILIYSLSMYKYTCNTLVQYN